MSLKKIIITGGAGFIGSHLSNKLIEKGYNLRIIDQLNKNKIKKKILLNNSKKINYSKINLQNNFKQKLIKASYVFHLAASLGVKNINQKPYEAFKNNVISLINLINNLKKFSPNTILIFFSTSEVYAPAVNKNKSLIPTDEKINLLISNKTINRDSYYLSKLIGEKIVQLSGLKYIILRPHNIFGPKMGVRHVISELISKLKKKNKKITIFSPNHTRAFCYIDDAINQIIKIAFNKNSLGQIFNVGNGNEEIRIYKLAQLIKKLMLSNTILKKGRDTPGSPKRRVPDTKKNIKITKFKNNIDLKSGIKKTINYMTKNKFND